MPQRAGNIRGTSSKSTYFFIGRKLRWGLVEWTLLIGIFGLLFSISQGIADTSTGSLTMEVTKVYSSPGFWTGTIEATQWIDVTVKRSSNSVYKTGRSLHVGIPVVRGSKLFNPDTRSFDERQVGVGRLLAVKMNSNCLHVASATEFKVEPACVQVVKGR